MHTAVPESSPSVGETNVRSFGILSTFPPTSCGIATFSAALAGIAQTLGIVAAFAGAGIAAAALYPGPMTERMAEQVLNDVRDPDLEMNEETWNRLLSEAIQFL